MMLAGWGAEMGKLLSNARASALPLAILLLVVVMVVPIPAPLLDVFFIANIAISLAVLMVALNAQKPLDFSAFPTVLLFATLFRLGLNVASTRIVLVHGHEGESAAGHVIEAFGTFLIGGDYVVGIFVFAILMIINLIVVTKGAGRVSEVSARFTLDALPGKQMAIDADLNAGLITPDEAKARRVEVSTEADFYGSMDGSSKFVKGDAVAGDADPRRQHRRRPDPRPGQPRHVDRRRRAQLHPARDRRRAGRAAAVADAVDRRRRDRHARHLRQGSRRPDRRPVRVAPHLDAGRGHPRRCSACCRACRTSSSCPLPAIAGFAAWKLRQIAARPALVAAAAAEERSTSRRSAGTRSPTRCRSISTSATAWCRWSTSVAVRR